jgi:hypothetical protein
MNVLLFSRGWHAGAMLQAGENILVESTVTSLRYLSPLAAGDRRHGLEYPVVSDECVEECGREMEQNDREEQKGEIEVGIPELRVQAGALRRDRGKM